MVKLKMYPFDGDASLPYSVNLEMVKLTVEEAVSFDRFSLPTFEDWFERFEEDRWLKEAEFYDGYVLVRYGNIAEVVKMNGIIHKIPVEEAKNCSEDYRSKQISSGLAWRIVCPLSNGSVRKGEFVVMSNLADCAFDEIILYMRSVSRELEDVEPKVFNQTLHQKLVDGLLRCDKTIELTEAENRVLQVCLMSRYKDLFYPLD